MIREEKVFLKYHDLKKIRLKSVIFLSFAAEP